jgi:heavy metal translocating P-type ATPase
VADRRRFLNLALLALAAAGLAAGLTARWVGWTAQLDWVEWARWADWSGQVDWAGWALRAGRPAQVQWATVFMVAGTVPILAAVLIDSVASLVRGKLGLDLIALISIGGAIALDEYVAAGVIGLMLAGGRALEDFAEARARREMTALLARVPRTANRYENGQLGAVPLQDVAIGDRLLVRAGETVPVDGLLRDGGATLDEAALTGEPLPVRREVGEALRSGAVNAGAPFDMEARTTAADSTFAGIVRLVKEAQETKAPAVRLADRTAFVFTPVAIAVAGAAWAITGDPIRGLAVMVVATPCPLLLGVPVAIVSGLSRCAGRGVLVKGGGALERLARAQTLFLDKTGTLTGGRARLVAVETASRVTSDEVLRLGASLDQISQHVIAGAVVEAAHNRSLTLAMPTAVEEEPGAGITGSIEGRRISVGSYAYVAPRAAVAAWCHGFLRRMGYEGATGVFVAADGEMLGALLMADEIRPDSPRALRLLRRAGITRIVMLTGDRRDVAEAIGAALGVDDVLAEQRPEDKLAAVTAAREQGVCVMVGDGVNDAPALAAASVGVAMGARGSGASSETAEVVLLVDRLDRLADALAIAAGTRRIAVQTVAIGMGLSGVAMVVAAAGFLPPVAGALLQEVIDVAAILNALRVLRVRIPGRPRITLPVADIAQLTTEHDRLAGLLSQLRTAADQLATAPPAEAAIALIATEGMVREQLLRHEHEDGTLIYPRIEQSLGGDDPIASMHRTHREVQHLGRLLGRMVADLPPGGPDHASITEFQRVLYGLDAILRLHFAQEDELYQGLADTDRTRSGRIAVHA